MERDDSKVVSEGVGMQLCPNCKKKIRYIAITPDDVVACDTETTVVYTDSGRRLTGYTVHKCEVRDEGKGNEAEKGS